MKASHVLALSLLVASAGIAAADGWSADEEDEVDRTDFSETHLKSDIAEGPSADVDAASLLPDLMAAGKVPVDTKNTLLVSLANLGSKMYNVTFIEGELLNSAGKRVETYPKKKYGEALNPREQRSFRYLFTPDPELALGPHSLTFTVYYTNKDKDPFMDVVYNEKIELVPKFIPANENLMLYVGVGCAAVLLVGLLYTQAGSSPPSGSSKKTNSKAASGSGSVGNNEWLEGTHAAGAGSRKGSKRA